MAVTRRVKIVCTLGPATASPERIRGLVDAGMDVARLNFSHGSHADHEMVYKLVREAAKDTGRAVAVLADLQGPKIRLGRFADGPHEWRTGDVGGHHQRRHPRHPRPGLLHVHASCRRRSSPATGC